MQNFDSIIIILYGAIVVFFLYRLIKQKLEKKHLEGNIEAFPRPSSSFEIILFSILVVTGAVNLYYGYQQNNITNIITALVMIALGVVFFLSTRSKLYVAENGILTNASFSNFKQLRKWGFDKERGDFVMILKKDHAETKETTRVKKEDIEKINDLIRKYKLGK